MAGNVEMSIFYVMEIEESCIAQPEVLECIKITRQHFPWPCTCYHSVLKLGLIIP